MSFVSTTELWPGQRQAVDNYEYELKTPYQWFGGYPDPGKNQG